LANEEWGKLQEALRQAPTPEARKAAAEAMRRYLAAKQRKGSRPELVSLGYKTTYPHSIPLENIPEELEKNPQFFELFKRIVTKEKS